jgi:hydroxyethylthiazole kinase
MSVDLDAALESVAEGSPLVNAVTNNVTVNDVAQVILHWGGLPVMSDDEREVGDMVAAAQACLLNMGTVSETGEATMIEAGQSANEHGVPVVLDPVGVGSTPTRNRVAERLATELDVAVIKGNYGEVAALAGEDAEVRGVESVGEYADVATTAVACAQRYDAVVVASGETDVVATADAAYEVTAGDPDMGTVVGTGCMLGGTLATFAGAMDPETAALAGTVAFGLAGEAAADGAFGEVHGPGSYNVAFKDAIAGLRETDHDPADARVEELLTADAE